MCTHAPDIHIKLFSGIKQVAVGESIEEVISTHGLLPVYSFI